MARASAQALARREAEEAARKEADAAQASASLFADDSVAYLHIHMARPGCYAARVDRA